MGWHIDLFTNDVKIPLQCAKDLWNYNLITCDELWDDEYDVSIGLYLNFNSDHMEHMDFLCRKDYRDILLNHKVEGDITFCSYETDEYWGYRFDGDGGYKKLAGKATITFVEEE